MVIEYVKKAWDTYKNNATSFIVAKIVSIVIVGIIAAIGIGTIFSSFGWMRMAEFSTEEQIAAYIEQIMQSPMAQFSILMGLGGAIIFFLLAAIAGVLLKIGIYGMAAESLRGRTKVETMFKIARQKGLNAIAAAVIMGIVFFILLMIMEGLSIALPLVGTVIGFIILIAVAILFVLVPPAIVIERTGMLNSIQKAVKIAKKNYFELLGLLIIYGIVTLLVAWIPIVGPLVILLVIGPMLSISLVFFYRKKK